MRNLHWAATTDEKPLMIFHCSVETRHFFADSYRGLIARATTVLPFPALVARAISPRWRFLAVKHLFNRAIFHHPPLPTLPNRRHQVHAARVLFYACRPVDIVYAFVYSINVL
jgi:hypothetical protein